MSEVVLDIETKNTFDDIGEYDPAKLDVSLLVAYDYGTDTFLTFTEENLKDLWPLLEGATRVIGYNLFHFDYAVLNRYYNGDLSTLNTLDLLVEFQNVAGHKIKLDSLLKVNMGTHKIGDGLDAVRYWNEGKIKELEKYCREDVNQTKLLYEFIKTHGFVEYDDKIGERKKVYIDVSDKGQMQSGVNLSLGI